MRKKGQSIPTLRRALGGFSRWAGRRAVWPVAVEPEPAAYRATAERLESHLRESFLDAWFPRCVDRVHGGFHQDFAEDWTARAPSDRIVVHQARQTWVAARAALHAPDLADRFARHALHGLSYLAGPMWDDAHGGPFFFLTPEGRPATERGAEKHACGAAFAIFAASATWQATRDARAAELAMRTFEWLDARAHDAERGGYFEALAGDGTPSLQPPRPRLHDAIGTPYGLKTLNTHIHVLEALVGLYGIRREALVRARLEETLALVRDRMTVPPGALNFYFTADWCVLPMHDSFGHDVEAAYLMQCAADVLGGEEAAHTARVARGVVDHALDCGWDRQHGGLWFAGQAFGPPFDRTKSWWVQAESLNALLVMHERYGHETDRYWTAFLAQLRFIWNRLVDHRRGGWFPRASEDGSALVGIRDKAMPWKAAYHDGRALMNAVEALRRMAAT